MSQSGAAQFPITPERLAELDYEAAQAEKRDRMNARLKIWHLLFTLMAGSGVVSALPKPLAYVVMLYPILAAFLARFAGHSESVKDQLQAHLLKVEERAEYEGYEHFNKSSGRQGGGNHKRALRDAILVTDALAVAAGMWHMLADGRYVLAGAGLLAALVAAVATYRWLRSS